MNSLKPISKSHCFLAKKLIPSQTATSTVKNIFEAPQYISQNFEIPAGQRSKISETGEIIKYSLVGKPEWFLRVENDMKNISECDIWEKRKRIACI